jgi:hypothetical protein
MSQQYSAPITIVLEKIYSIYSTVGRQVDWRH